MPHPHSDPAHSSTCTRVHHIPFTASWNPAGTNNQALLKDPAYAGLRKPRVTGQAYEEVVAEFVAALKAWQPHVLLQFEVSGWWAEGDQGSPAAVRLRCARFDGLTQPFWL